MKVVHSNKNTRKLKGYWCLENCIEDALKYKTKSDWQKNSNSAYIIAHKNNWLELCCSHMSILWEEKWTEKKKCVNVALKCKTKTEFTEKYCGAYAAASKNGWLNDCFAHMKSIGSKYKRLIYAFEFPDKSVYVGLTYNSQERKNEHLNPKRIKKSAVYQHIQKTNLQPEYKELTEYLDRDIASKMEGELLDNYKLNGWKVLNKNKTGALGGNILKWTKEKCLIEATKYTTRSKFQSESKGAYASAYKRKWLDECCEHMKKLFIFSILLISSFIAHAQETDDMYYNSKDRVKSKGVIQQIQDTTTQINPSDSYSGRNENPDFNESNRNYNPSYFNPNYHPIVYNNYYNNSPYMGYSSLYSYYVFGNHYNMWNFNSLYFGYGSPYYSYGYYNNGYFGGYNYAIIRPEVHTAYGKRPSRNGVSDNYYTTANHRSTVSTTPTHNRSNSWGNRSTNYNNTNSRNTWSNPIPSRSQSWSTPSNNSWSGSRSGGFSGGHSGGSRGHR